MADGEGILMSSMPKQRRSDDMRPVGMENRYRRSRRMPRQRKCELYKTKRGNNNERGASSQGVHGRLWPSTQDPDER